MYGRAALMAILLLQLASSCRSVRYAENPGAVYYDFGTRAHYYSDTARAIGLELYHGFDVFDRSHPPAHKDLPKEVWRTLRRSKAPVLVVLRYYLNPSIIVVQEMDESKSSVGRVERRPAIFKKAGAGFHADTVLRNVSGSYLVHSFSQKHRWMRSEVADEPSMDVCLSDIRDAARQWSSGDFIRALPRPDNFLLGEASAAFKRSKNNYLS